MQIIIDCFSAEQLSQMVWSEDAKVTLAQVIHEGKGDDLIKLLEQIYVRQTPTLLDINTLLADNYQEVFKQLSI